MSLRFPLSAIAVFAFCFCAIAGPIFAEDEPAGNLFSESWLLQRELEMTRDLAREIERENSASVARYVGIQLAGASRAATGPAAFDVYAGDEATATRSRMRCRAEANGSMACVVHPVD